MVLEFTECRLGARLRGTTREGLRREEGTSFLVSDESREPVQTMKQAQDLQTVPRGLCRRGNRHPTHSCGSGGLGLYAPSYVALK